MKLREILSEEYFDSFVNRYNKYIEIFRNPTRKELKELSSEDIATIILDGNNVFAWSGAVHTEIINHFKLHNVIPLYYDLENNRIFISETILTTLGIPSTFPSGQLKEMVLNHPWVKQTLMNPEVYLWDE